MAANLVSTACRAVGSVMPGGTDAQVDVVAGGYRDGEPGLAIAIAGSVAGMLVIIATMAKRLRDERHRLDELAVGDLAVRASFQVSYDSLSKPRHGTDVAVGEAYVEGHALHTWAASTWSLAVRRRRSPACVRRCACMSEPGA
jgi:hypothetical protein